MSILFVALLEAKNREGSAAELAAELRSAVLTGRLERGAQLPTIRRLMDETGLTYSSVSRAFAILQAEGLLVSRKRAGTFVAAAPAVRAPASAIRVFALIGPELSTGYYPALQRAFDLASGQRGFQIIASNTNNDVRVQSEAILQLLDKSIAGVAIVPATLGPPPTQQIRQLQQHGVPVVMLHRAVEGVSAPLVTIPAEEVGALAGGEIVKRGHRRVAYLASQRAGVSARYESGLRKALLERGVELREEHAHYGDFVLFDNRNYASYEARLAQWFERQMVGSDRPTALFTSFETVGELAYLMAIERGIRVPDELSIVSVGAEERAGILARRLACVTVNEQKAGTLTVELLDQMHQGERPIENDERFTIEIGFDVAQSLSPAAPTN